MTTLEILRKGRELLSDPDRWTQGALARRGNGDACVPTSSNACAWCSQGVVSKLGERDKWGEISALLSAQVYWDYAFWHFQDRHTHPEVIAAWDAAISSLESKGRG